MVRPALNRLGLLPAARRLRHLARLAGSAAYRRAGRDRRRLARMDRERFVVFRQRYLGVLPTGGVRGDGPPKKALVISSADFPHFFAVELALVKALGIGGFSPVVLDLHGKSGLADYYGLAEVDDIRAWSSFSNAPDVDAAEADLEHAGNLRDLLSLEHAGTRAGRFAVATALRALRQGHVDLEVARDRMTLARCLAGARAAAEAAQRIIREVRPDLLLLLDSMYSPEGELVDACVNAGIDVAMYALAHRSGSLYFKRYTPSNRSEHPVSLSEATWQLVRDMPWTDAHRGAIHRELEGTYANGDWYSVCGTQFGTVLVPPVELRKRLGLDPAKRTAVIFPHISWDASMIWGEDLFDTYEEWLVETVRTACRCPQANWVIKIHPAHLGKNTVEGKLGEPAEAVALRRAIGELPTHVSVIPAGSDISTYSLFGVMDYCLTVRGTVGVEAARLGIPVLTAGTGRYDRRGFTIDSDSRDQFLERVARILEIPGLSSGQRDLADRFAYGLFLMRPLPLSSVSFRYDRAYGVQDRFLKTSVNVRNAEEWNTAPDLGALADWFARSRHADFLMPSFEQRALPGMRPAEANESGRT
jgi:hypothetical protein